MLRRNISVDFEKKKRKKRANFSPAVNDKQRFCALYKNIINELFHESIIIVVDIIRSNLSIYTDTIRKIIRQIKLETNHSRNKKYPPINSKY